MPFPRSYQDKYQILEKIDETNYSRVFKVADDKKNILVLKIARTNEPFNNDIITREYTILSRTRHPNIIKVFDYDVNDDGRVYFTLEFIDGKPINTYYKGYSEKFLAAILQIISALNLLRSNGIVHSDLKPDNILIDTRSDRAVLIDFGFAGIIGTSAYKGGTFGYVPPEVVKGRPIDKSSDLYSLGVIIYEILSGEKYTDAHAPDANIPDDINKSVERLPG